MFKNMLPIEANLQKNPDFNRHLQNSAYTPLVTALFSGASRVTSSLRRLSRAKN
ncbi:hypothetical protein ACBP46_09285 [Paenalcaligenes hominis]|uniref:hypothetical protein n=1 Tax=Paenalcaligenes hominis TaxID=643674 RepID=UPI0035245971